MKAEEFVGMVARMVKPGDEDCPDSDESASDALISLISLARNIEDVPAPTVKVSILRSAVEMMDKAAAGGVDDDLTDDEILNLQAAARALVAQVIVEADPLGEEAALAYMADEIAGTEVEQDPIICIEIKGGNVQAVYGSREVPVVVLDYDTDYAAEKDLIEVYSEEGVQCLPTVWSVDIAPKSVRKTIEALHGHGLWD
jgi:hypothetical protein